MPEPFDPRAYRRVVGRFATGVTVVTTRSGGVDHAMTCNSFTSVSLDPVMVLFCPDRSSRLHDAVLDGGTFGVSVLADGQVPLSRRFAERGREVEGQFDGVAHHRGAETGCVLLDGALATLECRTTSTHAAGDHTVVLGEVVSLGEPAPDAGPLVWFEARYRALDPA